MAKKERKLTPAEAKRKELFEEKSQKLAQHGYVKKDLTIGVVKANVMAIVIMLPIVILFFFLYYVTNLASNEVTFNPFSGLLFLVSLVVLTIIHEGVHGITWAFFAKHHFHDIDFGFIWHMLTPYCTCNAELLKWQYLLGAIMPTFIVGIIPAIVSIILNNYPLFLLAMAMIIGGGGDALIVLKLLFYKENGKECIYMDHPYECGMVVFER